MRPLPLREAPVQEPIELILVKHWASYTAIPIFIVDADGNLAYYNEPAETIIGRSFDEAGEINAADMDEMFVTSDRDGNRLSKEELPIVQAFANHVPAHRSIRFRGLDGTWRDIDVTALPLIGQGGRHVGALAVFWPAE